MIFMHLLSYEDLKEKDSVLCHYGRLGMKWHKHIYGDNAEKAVEIKSKLKAAKKEKRLGKRGISSITKSSKELIKKKRSLKRTLPDLDKEKSAKQSLYNSTKEKLNASRTEYKKESRKMFSDSVKLDKLEKAITSGHTDAVNRVNDLAKTKRAIAGTNKKIGELDRALASNAKSRSNYKKQISTGKELIKQYKSTLKTMRIDNAESKKGKNAVDAALARLS